MATAEFLTRLLGVLSRTASAPSPVESLEGASDAFRHLAPFDGAGLMLPREPIRHSYGRGYELWTAGTRDEPEQIPESAAIARADDVLIASRDELDCEVSRGVLLARGHASVLAARLRVAEERDVGILLLFGDDPEAFRGVDPGPLLAGASIVAVAIEHARDRAALERLANELGLRRRGPGDFMVMRDADAKRRTRGGRGSSPDLRTLAAIEREAIARVLAHTAGRVSGPRGAAAILGLKPTTLQSRMKKLGVARRA